MIIPTYDELNPDFGSEEYLNPAAKLYLLAWDTDIDLMWLGEAHGHKSAGLDFLRNLSTNLEIHGEWAHQYGVTKAYYFPPAMLPRSQNSDSYLLGLRYLTEREITGFLNIP